MADENSSFDDDANQIKAEVNELTEQLQHGVIDVNDADILEYLYHLWKIWANFQLTIVEPLIKPISPPIPIPPAIDPDTGDSENVFIIFDEGFRLTTSRGEEGFALGQSMRKFYNTIEKMIRLLIERLETGGIDKQTEVQVAFAGFELGQRKAFESILNLEHNVVVVNFDAGLWGEHYMQAVLEMAERGYGVPSSTPRGTK